MHTSTPRAARRLAVAGSAAAALAACTAAIAAAGPPPTAVYLQPAILVHGCSWHTATRTVRRHHHRHKVRHHFRTCGWAPHRKRGTLHLRWDARAVELGKLVINGHTVPNAPITVARTLDDGWGSAVLGTITTNAKGQFRVRLAPPSAVLTFSYGPIVGVQRIRARGHVSLYAPALIAGHVARIHGDVEGGYIPADGLIVQLWYRSDTPTWQPLGQLARAAARNGRWSTKLRIPLSTAGYTYQLHATVLGSRHWPWTATPSRVLQRTVL